MGRDFVLTRNYSQMFLIVRGFVYFCKYPIFLCIGKLIKIMLKHKYK